MGWQSATGSLSGISIPSPFVRGFYSSTQIMPKSTSTLVWVYEEQGDWDKAIAQHRKAIDLNPDDYMVHLNLARAYDAVKDGSKAIEHLRKAESIANKENDEKAKNESKNLLLALLHKYNE